MYRTLVAQDKIFILQVIILPVIIVKNYLRGVTYKQIVLIFMEHVKMLQQDNYRVLW